MNRRQALLAAVAGLSAAGAGALPARAQASPGTNPELEQVRALLRAHDAAFTHLLFCFDLRTASVLVLQPFPISFVAIHYIVFT